MVHPARIVTAPASSPSPRHIGWAGPAVTKPGGYTIWIVRCASVERPGGVRRGPGDPASAISGPDPGLVERGVLHALRFPAPALRAGHEIAVDGVDGPVPALDDGRVVIGATGVLLQVP